MASILWSILIGISTNFDNLGIGLSYGIRKTHIPWLFYILTALTSFSACVFGGMTALRIGHFISVSTSDLFGSLILVCIGFWSIIQAFTPQNRDFAHCETLGFSEMMFIALAEGLADLSIGFGTGFAKQSVFGTAFSVGFFSFLFLSIPVYFGRRLLPLKFSKSAKFFSGFLLIVVGMLL
jgi:putative Mn2+ efflux pump MntP